MIIMASASGTPVPAIAALTAADEDTVRDVIHLFNQKGLAALDPQWAGGRPRLISDENIEVIVTTATTRPEKLGLPFTHWSLRKLAAHLDSKDVRLAEESHFAEIFADCEVGAMPPFGNLYGLQVYVDPAVAEAGTITFNVGTHTDTMSMAYMDFARLVQPTVVDLARHR